MNYAYLCFNEKILCKEKENPLALELVEKQVTSSLKRLSRLRNLIFKNEIMYAVHTLHEQDNVSCIFPCIIIGSDEKMS